MGSEVLHCPATLYILAPHCPLHIPHLLPSSSGLVSNPGEVFDVSLAFSSLGKLLLSLRSPAQPSPPLGKKKGESVRKSGGEARGADWQSEGAGGRAGETGSGKKRGKTTWENRKEREDREGLGVRERTCGWMCE